MKLSLTFILIITCSIKETDIFIYVESLNIEILEPAENDLCNSVVEFKEIIRDYKLLSMRI